MDITYVKAVFGSLRKTRTQPVYRDDHDLILQLVGVKGLPVHFQAHFSNTEYGTAVVMMGSDGEVSIPNTLLATGLPIYCWILVEQGISGAVRYSVQIPVRQKARPDGTIPPEQADIISQAISALNDAGANAQEAADSAAQSAEYVAGVKDDLYDAIDRVGVLEEAKEITLEAAGNAEAWAVGNRGGSAVPSTDPTYHNNAKYYAEQAAESARTLTIDSTLTQAGQAADAETTGREIDSIANISKDMLSVALWEFGNINASGGNASGTTHIRTAKYIPFGNIKRCELAVESGYSVTVYLYDALNTVTIKPTASFDVPDGSVKFRVKIGKGSDTQDLDFANHITMTGIAEIGRRVIANAEAIAAKSAEIFKNADDIEQLREIRSVVDTTFSQGTINASTGAVADSTTRIRTQVLDDSIGYIKPTNDYGFLLYAYNSGGYVGNWNGTEFIKKTTGNVWFSTLVNLREIGDYKFRIAVKRSDNADIDVSEGANVIFESDTDNTLAKRGKIADARATGTIITGDTIPESVFSKGGLLSGNDDSYRQVCRMRTPLISSPLGFIVTSIDQYAAIGLYLYNADGTYTATSLTKQVIIPPNTPARFYVDGRNTLASAEMTIAEIYAKIIISNAVIPVIESDYIQTATPNILYQARDGRAIPTVPPQSKYAVMETAKNQYDRIRFTVRVTTDGYYFCCHDSNINALAVNPDGTAISGTVTSSGHTLAELNAYDWGLKYGQKYAGLTVPLLEDGLKYASLYNLGVTLEYNFLPTTAQNEELFAMFAKYGILDNLLMVIYNNNDLTQVQWYADHSNGRISYLIGGSLEALEQRAEFIAGVRDKFKDLYASPTPFGTVPDAEYIAYAAEHNLKIYFSDIMSFPDLVTNGFDKGIRLAEIANIAQIKTTVRKYADSLIGD